MSELVTFLLAQLDADEAVARAATPGPWACADEHGNWPGATPAWCVNEMRDGEWVGDIACLTQDEWDEPNARHIAAHDPARVLVEVEAKRAIVELHRPRYAVVYRESDRLLADAFDSLTVPTVAHSGPVWPTSESEATLRLLAVPFADRPGFDETWRP